MYDQRPSGDKSFYQGSLCSWSKSSCAIEQGEALDASLQQCETAATPMALAPSAQSSSLSMFSSCCSPSFVQLCMVACEVLAISLLPVEQLAIWSYTHQPTLTLKQGCSQEAGQSCGSDFSPMTWQQQARTETRIRCLCLCIK